MLALATTNCAEKQRSQNPSPMAEHIRPHERIEQPTCSGEQILLADALDKPVSLFIPNYALMHDSVNLIIHFHGAAKVINQGACQSDLGVVIATVNLGSGSSRYGHPFLEARTFHNLLSALKSELAKRDLAVKLLILSGFSAGYGAIRAILSEASQANQVDGILLLDGLHTDYIPKGTTLHEGGTLNEAKLESFLGFARKASHGEKRMLFTHSSIFPGTYASTTECADYIVNELGLLRIPTLKQGPMGMQQVGMTEKGNLKIWAFAGNTAPDHIDHLHGFDEFINQLMR